MQPSGYAAQSQAHFASSYRRSSRERTSREFAQKRARIERRSASNSESSKEELSRRKRRIAYSRDRSPEGDINRKYYKHYRKNVEEDSRSNKRYSSRLDAKKYNRSNSQSSQNNSVENLYSGHRDRISHSSRRRNYYDRYHHHHHHRHSSRERSPHKRDLSPHKSKAYNPTSVAKEDHHEELRGHGNQEISRYGFSKIRPDREPKSKSKERKDVASSEYTPQVPAQADLSKERYRTGY